MALQGTVGAKKATTAQKKINVAINGFGRIGTRSLGVVKELRISLSTNTKLEPHWFFRRAQFCAVRGDA